MKRGNLSAKLFSERAAFFLAMLFFAVLLSVYAIQNFGSQTISLKESDSGKTLTVSKGQFFTITLPSHVDGGYRFDKVQYDSSVLRLQRLIENAPPPKSGLGRSGMGAWQFIALKKGKSTIKITASRPWKGGGTVVIFENKVMVK